MTFLKIFQKERDVMVGNFINNLVNREFLRKLSCSKDLLKRFLSSFLFIPMIALVWFLNDVGFEIFCWIIFSMIVKELFDSEIKGNLFWITFLLFRNLLFYICSFYVRKGWKYFSDLRCKFN